MGRIINLYLHVNPDKSISATCSVSVIGAYDRSFQGLEKLFPTPQELALYLIHCGLRESDCTEAFSNLRSDLDYSISLTENQAECLGVGRWLPSA